MVKLTEDEIGGLAQAEIAAAIEYDRSDFLKDRVRAIEYYRGEMRDLPAEEGRSTVTTHDVQDTIGWMLPGLMRVFFSADQLGRYEPQKPNDEPAARQATDYVNYVIMRECDGYQVFWDVFHDALLHANGIVKHWWDTTPKVETHIVTGLTDDQLAMLLQEDDVEVIEHSVDESYPEMGPLHALKFNHTYKGGCLKIAACPPEEFLIDRRATCIEDARFVGHRKLMKRSDLIEMGFKRDDVEKLPTFGSLSYDRVELARREQVGAFVSPPGTDKSTEEVEVIECYLMADQDGDGVAERLRVWMGGGGSTKVLDWEVWESDVPFTDFVAERVPHRWQGRSVFNDTEDIQRVKTVLLRQFLDNMYQSNIPDRVVDETKVENPDALYDRQIGNVIRVKGDPGAAVFNATVPFVAKEALTGLDYMDQMIERRTGVSRSTMALDLEALQNQSATAVNAAQSAAYSKIELIARNFAEMGFKRFFRCVLKLLVENQDRPKTIRLRDQWVDMDPRGWNADMDFDVNVGLGSGSRDRDVAILMQVATKQEQIMQLAGPVNPICDLEKYSNTLRKLVEMAGLRNPDTFFGEVNQQTLQQFQQQQGQKPDPKVEAEKAKIQIEGQKAQAQMQLEQQKAAASIETQRQKNALDMEAQREKHAMDMQIAREKAEFERQQRQEDAVLNAQLRREEMQLEAALTQEANRMNAAVAAKQADTNIDQKSV